MTFWKRFAALKKTCEDLDVASDRGEEHKAEDLDTVVTDYFHLLKAVCRGGKPTRVALDFEDFSVVTVDGVPYNFDLLIRHSDRKNTERRMEIEALIDDERALAETEKRLNEKIAAEW